MTARATGGGSFRLRVLPRPGRAWGLELLHRPPRAGREEAPFEPVVRVWGDPLAAVVRDVLEAVRRAGYRASAVRRSRRDPFELDEVSAVRLGVLFLAIKPLRKLSRIEAIARHVRGMEPEELWYWFSKMTLPGDPRRARRARRALRLLLAEE